MSKIARPLGGALAAVAISQVVSTVVYSSVPRWEESFATLSNLAYIFSGCYHHFLPKPRSGNLRNPAFPLLILGVTSFAFHGEPEGHVQKHTLDVWAGWVLVLHLACTAMSAATTEAFSELSVLRPYTHLVDVGFVVLFPSTVLAISGLYSRVYENQLLFYMICSASAVAFALTIRIRLSVPTVISTLVAVFESIATLGIAVSAVYQQGGLVGKELSHSTSGRLYDFHHGMWHIQLGLVVSLLHIRYADVLEQTQQAVRKQSHIVRVGVLDLSWLFVFLAQAIVLLLLKEFDAPVQSLAIVLWVVSVLHVLHMGRFVYITYGPGVAYKTDDVSVIPFIVMHN